MWRSRDYELLGIPKPDRGLAFEIVMDRDLYETLRTTWESGASETEKIEGPSLGTLVQMLKRMSQRSTGTQRNKAGAGLQMDVARDEKGNTAEGNAMEAYEQLPPVWQRPILDTQPTLFPQPAAEVLAELHVSFDDAQRWSKVGWLSFEAIGRTEIDEPEQRELRFVRNIARSGLSDSQVNQLLSQLRKPYCYDPESTAYHFRYGWVSPRWSHPFPVIEQHLTNWIDYLVSVGDLGPLDDLRGYIDEQLDDASDDEEEWQSTLPLTEKESRSSEPVGRRPELGRRIANHRAGRRMPAKTDEPIAQNNHPVAQIAKQAMKELGEETSPNLYYPLQLMSHVVDNGLMENLDGPLLGVWREEVDRLLGESPEEIEALVVEDGEEAFLTAERLKGLKPVEVGAALLESLHASLVEKDPGYAGDVAPRRYPWS